MAASPASSPTASRPPRVRPRRSTRAPPPPRNHPPRPLRAEGDDRAGGPFPCTGDGPPGGRRIAGSREMLGGDSRAGRAARRLPPGDNTARRRDNEELAMERRYVIALGVLVVFGLFGCAQMRMPVGGGSWTTLIDGASGLENWDRVGDANWRAEGGALLAHKG